MEGTEKFKDQVISDLRACLISSQGGIPANSLNNDYKQLLGQPIPFRKLGFNNLESFLKSVPEISLKNVNGELLVEAKKNACSNHITKLVERQRKSTRRRTKKSQLKRNLRPINGVPLRQRRPPRYNKALQASHVPKSPDKQGDNGNQVNARRTNMLTPPAVTSTPLRLQPLVQSSIFVPNESFINPNVPSNSIRPFFAQPISPRHLQHNPQTFLPTPSPIQSPPPQFSLLYGNMSPTLLLKQQALELSHHIQQLSIPGEVLPQKTCNSTKKSKNFGHKQKLTKFESLPLPKTISEDNYFHKLLALIKKFGWPEPEISLFRQRGGNLTCVVSLKCYKPGEATTLSVGELEFTTYPDEIKDATKALNEATKKAYDTIMQRTSENYPHTNDANLMMERICEMVKDKLNGIWAFQIERDYVEKYKESLPNGWIDTVKKSKTLCAVDLGHSYVVKPYIEEDNMKLNPIREKLKHILLTIPKLNLPETDEWPVYITKVHSISEVWIRLIGNDFHEKLEQLTKDIEDCYLNDKTYIHKVEVGKYYAAICEDSVHRVIVKESHSNEVLVHFIDHGDDELLPLNLIRELKNQFYSLPAQALLVHLSGLEYLSKFECRDEIMDKLVGKSCVAIVEEREPYFVILYDTAETKAIDINKMLIDTVLEETLEPAMFLQVGTVREIRICHVNNSGHVYVQLTDNPALELLEERLKAVKQGECEIHRADTIQFNKIYIIKYNDVFSRVIAFPANNFLHKVDIHFVDKGTCDTVPTSDLYEITDSYDILNSLPYQAIRIYLKDILKLTEKKINKLKAIVPPETPVISKVVEVSDHPILELFIRNQTDRLLSSVNHSIELEDLLENTKGETYPNLEKQLDKLRIIDKLKPDGAHSRIVPATVMPIYLNEKDIYVWDGEGEFFEEQRVKIPAIDEQYFEIYVSDVANPSNFTVQPLQYVNELNKLTKEMKSFYDNTVPCVTNPLHYQVYAVLHPDNYWYRGCVHRIFNDSVTVRLCDFGNFEVMSLQKLRPLLKRFMVLPFLGFKASLAGIAPKHTDWNVADCLSVSSMIKGKKFISIIKDVISANDDKTLILDVIDTSKSNADVNISHQLVLDGKAVYK